MEVGSKVTWAGKQDPRCAPGFNGTVQKRAHHDPNSFRVFWDERDSYTWERRKNLNVADGAGQAGEPQEGPPRTSLTPASASSPAP